MKKIITSAVLLLAISAIGVAQKKETINVPTFNKIGFAGAGTLYLKQGSTQRVELEGDPEVLERYEIKVEGERLVIRPKDKWFDWNWGNNERITAYVTAKEIESIGVAGSGDVIAQTKIVSNELDLKISGSGSLKAEVEVSGDLEADVSGSGDIEIRGTAGDFDTDISGSGDVNASLTIAGGTTFAIAGSGKIVIDGKARDMEARISGSGNIRGVDFEVEKCRVKIAGSGDVEISVKDELDVNIAGGGNVRYRGNPTKVNSHASGSGNVRKI
jgi:hypothetical protein